jgi:hypothetical protein
VQRRLQEVVKPKKGKKPAATVVELVNELKGAREGVREGLKEVVEMLDRLEEGVDVELEGVEVSCDKRKG